MTDVPIVELLESLGLTGDIAARARAKLKTAGITNASKQRISVAKIDRVAAELDRHYQRVCHACRARTSADGREIVQVPPAACPLCGGSRSRRSVDAMVEACRRADVLRLVVVGGSPNMRQELARTGRRPARTPARRRDTFRRQARRPARRRVGRPRRRPRRHPARTQGLDPLHPRSEARRKLVTTTRRGLEAISDKIATSAAVARGRRSAPNSHAFTQRSQHRGRVNPALSKTTPGRPNVSRKIREKVSPRRSCRLPRGSTGERGALARVAPDPRRDARPDAVTETS